MGKIEDIAKTCGCQTVEDNKHYYDAKSEIDLKNTYDVINKKIKRNISMLILIIINILVGSIPLIILIIYNYKNKKNPMMKKV